MIQLTTIKKCYSFGIIKNKQFNFHKNSATFHNNFHTNTITKLFLKSKKNELLPFHSEKEKHEKHIIKYKPKTTNQKMYEQTLKNKYIDLVFCIGPAGTGKTLFACKHALEQLNEGECNKIIITRPTITIEENLGFLPGNINQKMNPFIVNIFDICKEISLKRDVDSMLKSNMIEIVPLGFMQGRTFKNAIIIADEMQNSSPNQMFMLLTRLGENSKMIITGDPMQTTNKENGFYMEKSKITLYVCFFVNFVNSFLKFQKNSYLNSSF
jgi:phosphate starvation-inducible protein PhoH